MAVIQDLEPPLTISNNENGLEINEDLIESNWDKVTDK
jgi:hypothetical protein